MEGVKQHALPNQTTNTEAPCKAASDSLSHHQARGYVAGWESTLAPVTATAVTGGPEFVDTHGARQLFSLSKTHLYNLLAEKKIRACVLRKKGAVRGRRIWSVSSIRELINANMDEATPSTK